MSTTIHLNNPQAVFYPGSEVAGVVVFHTLAQIKTRSILISIDGRARNKWNEVEKHNHKTKSGKHTEHRPIDCEATVIYTNGQTVAWPNGSESDTITAGHHQFPFKFFLPPTCAPSFEGNHGNIKYGIKVEVDRNWTIDTTTKAFTVVPILDLNTVPKAMMPFEISKSMNTGMKLFRHGEVSVTTRLSKSGFVPGERIVILCDVNNESSRPVINAEIRLRQQTVFKASRSNYSSPYIFGVPAIGCDDTKEESKVIVSESQKVEVGPHKHQEVDFGLTIPPGVVSFSSCPIISVSLSTKGKMNTTIETELPVIIGTIPLRHEAPPTFVQPTNTVTFYPAIPSPAHQMNSQILENKLEMTLSRIYSQRTPMSQSPDELLETDDYPTTSSDPQRSTFPPSYEESVYGYGETT